MSSSHDDDSSLDSKDDSTAQVVEMSVTNNSLSKGYPHPEDHDKPIMWVNKFDMTQYNTQQYNTTVMPCVI